MASGVQQVLSELTTLVAPPPPQDVPTVDWLEVDASIGRDLPNDYRCLVDLYGGGSFDDYLSLYEPKCRNPYYDLAEMITERGEALEYLWVRGEDRPEGLEEGSAARLVCWATTDNGEYFFWLVAPGVEPDNWTVMVNEARGPRWESFDMGCLEFLVGVLSGDIESDILSSRFPTDPHSFERFPALEV